MSRPTLHVQCPTWEHVESFYLRKVKPGGLLSARVPFSPASGSELAVALELPDGDDVSIAAEVVDARSTPDGRRSAVLLRLRDFESEVRGRLEAAVARGRDGRGQEAPRPRMERTPDPDTRTSIGAPVPLPVDAPVDERIEPVVLPEARDVPGRVRPLYTRLLAERAELEQRAAHEVLGVPFDADVAAIRRGYFELTRRYHPDLFARHGSWEVSLLASELFVHANLAYDRLRENAVVEGKAIVAGSALLPHDGWLAGFDDLGSEPVRGGDGAAAPAAGERPCREPDLELGEPLFTPVPEESFGQTSLFDDAPLDSADDGAPGADLRDRRRERGRELLAAGDHEGARATFAEILESAPRDRATRALYHVAYGRSLADRGKRIEALTNYEAALVHDRGCAEAQEALDELRPRRERRPSLLERLFRR